MHLLALVATRFSTVPSGSLNSSWTVALGGQTSTQAASVQCMHWCLVNNQRIFPSLYSSWKSMRIQVSELSAGGFSYEPRLLVFSAGFWFHDLQATWQARQAVHLVVSTSIAFSFAMPHHLLCFLYVCLLYT